MVTMRGATPAPRGVIMHGMSRTTVNETTLRVDLPGRAYDVHIGSGLLDELGAIIRKTCSASGATIVTDSNVAPLYLERVIDGCRSAGLSPRRIVVPAGEASKSLAQLAFIHDQLAAARHERFEPIIALGGGMVGDLAGFAAATWMRGVPFVQCPTSLEAMIDASVGGKTAINHPAGKNLIGAFHQPALVCADADCLVTLPRREFVAALAESVKHAVMEGPSLLDWHEKNVDVILRRDPAVIVELIRENVRVKAAVVVADERETSAAGVVGRAALNFGHTIGHALESQSGYDLRHGEAVALGMIAELELAVRCRGFDRAMRDRIETLIARLGLPVAAAPTLNAADLLDRLNVDKKVRSAKVRFAVPTTPGKMAWLDDCDAAALQHAVGRLISRQ